MTQSAKDDGARLPSLGRGLVTLVVAATLISVFGATACDTVAQIPFSDRTFSNIYPVSVAPADQGQCGGLQNDATMSMVFMDNEDEPIKLDEEVALDFVNPDRDDISFQDGSAIYSLPDVECASDDDCPENFNCQSVDSQDAPGNRCQMTTGVTETDDPIFAEDNGPGSQAFLAAVSEAGQWRGWYSGELADYYPYDPETGETGDQLQSTPVGEIAVDDNRLRVLALESMADEWGTLNDYVEEDGRQAYFGFWSFGESLGEVRSRIGEAEGSDWTQSSITAVDTLDGYNAEGVEQSRSNIYESMIETLDRGFAEDSPDVEKATAVFVVPGHDEVRADNADGVLNAVDSIESQHDIELRVSIIQIDTSRDRESIPDDWEYYSDQTECSDDSECKNFESCREPTWYTQEENPAGEDAVEYPREEDRGKSFCLPSYDDQGRVGPIADYDRIACETGGAYHYVPQISREVVEEPLNGQVWASEALWQQDVVIDDAGTADGAPNLLETVMEVNIGSTETLDFNREDQERDRRQVFFTRDQE